jgi:hypothetical protein
MARKKETPRLMKDGLAAPAVKRLAAALAGAWAPFDATGFEEAALAGLEELELKDRVRQLIGVMNDFLPEGYPAALKTVVRAGRNFPADQTGDSLAGFAAWPLVDWVPDYGLGHFDSSLKALRNLTGLFTAEFAVRPFLIADTDRALRHLESWLEDPSEHVRRLVSEGTRPRLRWGCTPRPSCRFWPVSGTTLRNTSAGRWPTTSTTSPRTIPPKWSGCAGPGKRGHLLNASV